jgi:hypothetical protein
MVNGSILTGIKKLLGIVEEDTSFDTDIILHINMAFFNLNQLGIGPAEGYSITDKSTVWGDYLESRTDLEAVKTFVFLKTRLIFDPPQSGFLLDAIKEQIRELEWRLNVQIENNP